MRLTSFDFLLPGITVLHCQLYNAWHFNCLRQEEKSRLCYFIMARSRSHQFCFTYLPPQVKILMCSQSYQPLRSNSLLVIRVSAVVAMLFSVIASSPAPATLLRSPLESPGQLTLSLPSTQSQEKWHVIVVSGTYWYSPNFQAWQSASERQQVF